MCTTETATKDIKKTSCSWVCAPKPSHSVRVLGTRRPPIVKLSVTDVTEKLYRGVRYRSPKTTKRWPHQITK